MPTTKIMVIRHAEKPNGEPGIMPDGSQNPEALTAAGWSRARALVGLFNPQGGRFADPRLARPGSLFASGSDSLRPKQTLAPLAEALKLVIDANYLKGQEDRLVAAAKNAGSVTLVAWQHEAIAKIATLIRGSANGIPPRWPGHRFDLVWVFDREDNGDWSFEQAPELALPGDSSQPIALND
ncbi:MAG: histidine phosphatase family protein [Hyphomicrobiales bacterium]|nr:histidine phosphatase family protein [Hyphomicrobiales bacterium]